MCRFGSRTGVRRLLSIAAALALVLAQLTGSYAHARGHSQATGHAACGHVGGHHAAALGHDAASPVGDQGVAGEGTPGHNGALHSTSCDFVCHGGIAILEISGVYDVDQATSYGPAAISVANPSHPPSLERPPRFSARA
jgi:hypothetical protein